MWDAVGMQEGCYRDTAMLRSSWCRNVGGMQAGCCRDAGGILQDTFPQLFHKQRVFGSQIDSN